MKMFYAVLATYFAVWGFIIISLSTVTKVTQFANRQNGDPGAAARRQKFAL